MPLQAKAFLQRWLVNTLGVVVAAHVIRGIQYDTAVGLLVASLLLGILNAFLRPLMIVLALPLLIVSLGLFMLVINALLLYFVGWLVKPFHVETFGAAFWGALLISGISMVANWILGPSEIVIRKTDRKPPGPSQDGGGPVIDV
jgi:putative membrane protein